MSANGTLLTVEALCKRFGNLEVLKGTTLSANKGDMMWFNKNGHRVKRNFQPVQKTSTIEENCCNLARPPAEKLICENEPY